MIETLINLLQNDFDDHVVDSSTIKLDVPGYGKEDFNITLTDNLLEIKAEGFITKKYKLSPNVKDVTAKCDKGQLEIKLHKHKEKPKVIKVS